MYSVLLVDDEYLELRLLRDNIDWAAHGFRVCAAARNGVEALSLVQTLHPDVVITDIKMPVMDGIALSRQLHAQWSDTAILFLTGYDQYDYLKNALTVNAVDFLLKPIDLAAVPAVLQTVRQYCDERRTISMAARNNLREFVLSAATGSEANCSADYVPALRRADGTKTEHCYFTLLHLGELPYLQQKYGEQALALLKNDLKKCCAPPDSACVWLNAGEALLLSADSFSSDALTPLEAETRRWINALTTREPQPLKDTAAQIALLRRSAHTLLLHHGSGQYCALPCPPDAQPAAAQPEMAELMDHLARADKSAALRWLRLFYRCAGEDAHSGHLMTSELIDFLLAQLPAHANAVQYLKSTKTVLLLQVFSIQSPITMCDELSQYLIRLIDLSAKLPEAQPSLPLKRITEYIDANLTPLLSVETVASEFGFSANYFSTVFKREAGCTVLEYITERRLLRARSLLEDSSLKITQISSQLGYQNPSYFCALFSKKYGLTPAQYRRRCSE